jgi:hypothetical protein
MLRASAKPVTADTTHVWRPSRPFWVNPCAYRVTQVDRLWGWRVTEKASKLRRGVAAWIANPYGGVREQ